MAENGFSASDVVTFGAMNNYNRGGYGGGGAWGGGHYGGFGAGGGHGMWASPSSNAVRINRNADKVEDQNEFTREMIALTSNETSRAFDVQNLSREFTGVNSNINQSENRTNDRITANQLNSLRENADLKAAMAQCCCDTQKEIAQSKFDTVQAIAAAAKETAECCCEAKLQQCKDTAELKALIIKENGETRALMTQSALDAANAKITQLETINALRGHHGHPGC